MNVLKRIRAFFTKENKQVLLELSAAEIKNGKAFLHPKGERDITYIVRSDDVVIHLSDGKSLSDTDVMVVNKSKKKSDNTTGTHNKTPATHLGNSETPPSDFDRFKKRTFSVSLYQHEYDALVNTIKEYGYRRADFILASANTATKGTMEREHKKLIREHKEIRQEEKSTKINQKLDEK